MINIKIGLGTILSDHAAQRAKFYFKNGNAITIETHNMLGQCNGRNNAWYEYEEFDEYYNRLEKLALYYKHSIAEGVDVLGLQEAPKDARLADAFFQMLDLPNHWKYTHAQNEHKQGMMLIYNSAVTGNETTYPALNLNGRAVSHFFEINNQPIELINIHADFNFTCSYDIFELMNFSDTTKIRFGDHNGNPSKYVDLIIYDQSVPTSIVHKGGPNNFGDTDDDGNPQNYDGFACSNFDGHVEIYPSDFYQIFYNPLTSNQDIALIESNGYIKYIDSFKEIAVTGDLIEFI